MKSYFLDTNVLVSAALFQGNERKLLDAALAPGMRRVTSDYALAEAAHVFSDYFNIDKETCITLINGICEHVEVLHGPKASEAPALPVISDKDDLPIVAAVIHHKCVLVTGDKKLAADVKGVIEVLPPAELLKTLKL